MSPLSVVRLPAALLLTCVVGDALAHSELPSAAWCANGRVVEVARFEIEPQTLQQLRQDDECPPPGQPILKDCGQFDDDYGVAKRAADRACSAYARPPSQQDVANTGDAGSVVVLVESPLEYSAPTHHDDYTVDLGVSGMCVRCDMPLRTRTPGQPLPDPTY